MNHHVKLKDLLNKSINKTNKQISFSLRKREMNKKHIDINDILDMEIKSDQDFLK